MAIRTTPAALRPHSHSPNSGDSRPDPNVDGVKQIGVDHAGGIVDFHAFKALFQLRQLIDGFLHQFRGAINPAALD